MAGKLAVIGAGLMGSGIAQISAQVGWEVVVHDVDAVVLQRGIDGVRRSYDRSVAKDRMSTSDAEAALQRITTTTDLDAVGEAEIVVEAVFESLDVKRGVFLELDRICQPGAVLATNTSAIPITAIASATGRPESVVGTHFFSPVPMMALCELVRGYQTSAETLVTARAFAEGIGKTCIVVNRDVAGFVTTRLITALANEAARLVENGVATAEDIDTACQLGFGHAMGPLRTIDLTGIDILVHATENVYADTRDPKFAPPEILVRMVSAGILGRKSGQGFYTYES